jgi:beta-N-acetylhexosaminidase
MKALGGPFAERARAVIAAGCDVALHCSGELAEMVEVASAVPPLEGQAGERFARALTFFCAPQPFDEAEAMALVTDAAGTRVA